MQPASAKPSACTGDGPATPALSSVIDALSLVPASTRSPAPGQIDDRRWLGHDGIVARADRRTQSRGAALPVYRAAEPRATGAAGGGNIGLLETSDLMRDPAERQDDEQVGQQVTERAVGSPRFRAAVDEVAVRQILLLRHFVRALDHELHDEDEQEDRRHLEEQREVDAVAVARPQPGDAGGGDAPDHGAERQIAWSGAAASAAARFPSLRG